MNNRRTSFGYTGITVLVFLCTSLVGCVDTRKIPNTESDMQLVRGGEFRMGTDVEELDAILASTGIRDKKILMMEVPSHAVIVDSFMLDTYDVTNKQFAEFAQARSGWSKESLDISMHNGRYLEHWVNGNPPADLFNHPVTFVTWQSAAAYCLWRDKRLPTEAEFEWAAQDGVTRAEYPWGDEPPSNDVVSWGGNKIDSTVAVGSYPPNARGLYDMSGNVWHFTADPWLGSYAETLATTADVGQRLLEPGFRRVVRGGSWGANAANLRVRYRDSHRAFDAREMVGFRCARSLSDDE